MSGKKVGRGNHPLNAPEQKQTELQAIQAGESFSVEVEAAPASSAHDRVAAEKDQAITLSMLPPLQDRYAAYYTEPWGGVLTVLFFCSVFCGCACFSVLGGTHAKEGATAMYSLLLAVFVEAVLAFLCVFYILFAQAGVIKRSAKSCYPLPPLVEDLLLERNGLKNPPPRGRRKKLEDLDNVDGPDNHPILGSYCVRCFVWRPPRKENQAPAHHCRTCQRCVRGFDHHCGVFGRCIVAGNMPCFGTLVALLPVGFVTMAAVVVEADTLLVPQNSTLETATAAGVAIQQLLAWV